MKIGFSVADTHETRAGIGNYIFNLFEELKKDSEIEVTAIKYKSAFNFDIEDSITPWYPPIPFDIMKWSGLVALQKNRFKDLDLLHTPTLCLFPVKPHKRIILTVHDIIHYLYPHLCTRGTVRYTKLLFKKNLIMSDYILAISEATKKDLMFFFNIPEEKIHVTPLAASESFQPLPNKIILEIKKKYNLYQPFILFVGTIEPRKNIPLLIKAFSYCLKERPDLELVLSGSIGWKYDEIFYLIDKLNIKQKIRILGYIPHDDLPALYNAAEVFVYPSLYEGFGLPPLEAMQCGIPVITSNSSSLPEVVGKNGFMIDPHDLEGLIKILMNILTDKEMNLKNRLYNLEQAKKFSWKKTKEETKKIYQLLLQKKYP